MKKDPFIVFFVVVILDEFNDFYDAFFNKSNFVPKTLFFCILFCFNNIAWIENDHHEQAVADVATGLSFVECVVAAVSAESVVAAAVVTVGVIVVANCWSGDCMMMSDDDWDISIGSTGVNISLWFDRWLSVISSFTNILDLFNSDEDWSGVVVVESSVTDELSSN